MALGIWVIILPFLGFPGFWERLIILATGAIIAGIAYTMRPQARPASSNVPYVEHRNTASLPSAMPVEKSVPAATPAAETASVTPVHN